jgi:hypothetical protein
LFLLISSTILISKDYGRSFNPTNSSIGDWFMVSTDSTFSTIIGLQYLKKSVFYSYDLGSTWIEVTEAIDYRAFAIARLNSSIMLAAGGSSSYEYKTSPIYVSYNGGSSWQTGSPISKQWKSIATSESGEMVFVAGINSQTNEISKIDWRRGELKFYETIIPQNIETMCIALVKKLNLRFGAIDMIKDKNGNFVFLEINPNGQWVWIENETGLKISEALIDELL